MKIDVGGLSPFSVSEQRLRRPGVTLDRRLLMATDTGSDTGDQSPYIAAHRRGVCGDDGRRLGCDSKAVGPDPDIYNIKHGFERLDVVGQRCATRWTSTYCVMRDAPCSRYR